MSNFESVFIPFESGPSLQQFRRSRLKMGEIFHCGKSFALICIHCSTELTNFSAFAAHAQSHLMDMCVQVSMGSKSKNEAEHEENDGANSVELSADEDVSRFDTVDTTLKRERDDSDDENDRMDYAIEFDDENSDDAAGTIKLVNRQLKCDETSKPYVKKTLLSHNTKEDYLGVQKKLHSEGIELDNSPVAYEFFKYIYDFEELNADTIDLYQCPKCQHSCRRMANMRTHIFKHLHDNIFVCIECKRCFNRVGAVRQHVKKIHLKRKNSKERPRQLANIGKRGGTKKVPSAQSNDSEPDSDAETNVRRLRVRKKSNVISEADTESSSESSSSSNDDSVYRPRKSIESDDFSDNDNADVGPGSDHEVAQLSNTLIEDYDEKEVMLTSDDFQQHTKAVAKFKQKYIEISDAPVAVEYAKYALMSDFKPSASSFQCPKCPHTCAKFIEMRRHIFTHLKEKIFTCMFCRRTSNRLLRMEWHVSDHKKNNTKKLFERLYEKNSDISNDPDAVQSSNDEQLMIVRQKLNIHGIQLSDSSEGIKYAKYYLMHDMKVIDGHFQCPQCYVFIISRNSIRKHLFRHIKDEIFSCMICHEKSAAYEEIRRHMKLKHLKQINKAYANGGAESLDLGNDQSTDEGADTDIAAIKDRQRVLCTICGTSVKANGLKKHVNIHERRADFKCDLCDKSFLRKCKLLEHRRTHPEPMPFHCTICNKGYLLKKGLVRHLTTHGKETSTS